MHPALPGTRSLADKPVLARVAVGQTAVAVCARSAAAGFEVDYGLFGRASGSRLGGHGQRFAVRGVIAA